MNTSEHNNPMCWQIVIVDNELLSGSSTGKIIRDIVDMEYAAFILIEEADWILNFFSNMTISTNPIIINTEILLNYIDAIPQFDWFHFVFFESKECAFKHAEDNYTDKILYGKFTLRGVDNNYFYIYTNSDYIANNIIYKYNCTEYIYTGFDKIVFPY